MRPRLRRSVDARLTGRGDVLLLRGPGQGDLVLEGDGDDLAALLTLADGTRDVGELARELGKQPDEVGAVLDALCDEGVIDDGEALADALGDDDAARFDRQLDVFADALGGTRAAAAAQRRLGDASVCLLGLGGLGCWVALALAQSGVGALVGVDGDVVETSNLNRQVLYSPADSGALKAQAAGRTLQRLAPGLRYAGVATRLRAEADVAAVIRGADVVVSTVDQPAHMVEHWVQQATFDQGIPLLTLSQHPPLVRSGDGARASRTSPMPNSPGRSAARHRRWARPAASSAPSPQGRSSRS
jgi:hypothetical protein